MTYDNFYTNPVNDPDIDLGSLLYFRVQPMNRDDQRIINNHRVELK